MALIVNIEKTLGDFHLKVNFTAEREVWRCSELRLRQEHDAGVHRGHRETG